MSSKFYIGRDLTNFVNNGERDPISRVTIKLDDGHSYTVGDDTGDEFIAECVFATQEMADAMLAKLKGYVHNAFSAEGANIDPAAEYGDGITAMGKYSTLSVINDDGYGYPIVKATGEKETEQEYETGSPLMLNINRKIATTKAELRVDIDSISATVSDLSGDFTELKVTLDGVTITDSSGTTLIKGSSVETDTLNLTGKITFGDLSSGVQNDINDAWSMAYSAQSLASDVDDTISAWTYGSTTYIDGTKLMTGTVTASELQGGVVSLLASNGSVVGTITLNSATTAEYAMLLKSTSGAMQIIAASGAVHIKSGYYTHVELGSSAVYIGNANLAPNDDGIYSCGTASLPWSDVYATNATIQTSDRNKKNSIVYGLDAYDAFFDSLKPVSYKFNDGTSGRTHIGMIAQDVEASLAECGLTSMDFAGFISFIDEETEEQGYALRYGEFISLCIEQIQRLKARVSELEEKI